MAAESLLVEGRFTARVSSVLNKDTKQFGKKHLFDGEPETCWNSNEGSPQFIEIEFSSPVTVTEVAIQFQGGFTSRDCTLLADGDAQLMKFYPDDSSSLQCFPLPPTEALSTHKQYKIIFIDSTDFYGRITVYSLDLKGRTSS